MPITGDFERLARLREKLADARGLNLAASDYVAEEIDTELEAQYAGGFDPYNEGWAELAPSTLAGGRTPPPLTDTARMRRGSRALPGVKGLGGGVTVRVTRSGGNPAVPNFHQEGTERMPARMIVPRAGEPLPPAWHSAVYRGAGRAVLAHFEAV